MTLGETDGWRSYVNGAALVALPNWLDARPKSAAMRLVEPTRRSRQRHGKERRDGGEWVRKQEDAAGQETYAHGHGADRKEGG